MASLAPSAVKSTQDFLPLKGTDHVEFYVGNARQAAYYYRAAFGMSLVAYAGPETGQRDRASYMVQQGKIRFVFTTSLRPGDADRGACGAARRRRARQSPSKWTTRGPRGWRRPLAVHAAWQSPRRWPMTMAA